MNSMDRDGELQPEEDSKGGKAATACDQGEGRLEKGHGVSNAEKEGEVNEVGDHEEEEDSEEGDTTDGGPPPSMHEQVLKRRPVQSRRMQEYQDMQRMSSHQGRRLYSCQYCPRTFNSGPGLRYHERKKHASHNESFTCDTCQKEFKSNNGLKYHRKKNRCQGYPPGTESLRDSQGSRVPQPLTLPGGQECGNQKLMELAQIATGPQSPLLRSSQEHWNYATNADDQFDSSETSAAMALSTMAERKRQSGRLRAGHDDRGSQPLQTGIKPKRPMNGFLLFAQKNRAAFNRKFALNNRLISTKLSEAWNNLSEPVRQAWKTEAKRLSDQKRQEHPDCWKRKKYSKDGR